MSNFVNLTLENLSDEHLCCAIGDKKHQQGVDLKKEWLKKQIPEGHVFRKLNAKGKVFIEYAPLEKAWVPVLGDNYIHIYCLWVSGSFKDNGYGKQLLEYCIADAKKKKKSGICVISSKKKTPYLSDKIFFQKYKFEIVDTIGNYELLALSFDGKKPKFTEKVKTQKIASKNLTIYYGVQCPFIPNCIEQVQKYCTENKIKLELVKIDTLKKAKDVPAVFNNWALFYNGAFETQQLMNEGSIKKLLEKKK